MRVKTFTDPVHKIPPILETDISTKIIISYKKSPNNNMFLDYIIKESQSGVMQFRGSCKGSSKNMWRDDIVTWCDSYNNGITIMELLLKEQKSMEEVEWKVIYYVLESKKDIQEIINIYGINGMLETELWRLGKKLFKEDNCYDYKR